MHIWAMEISTLCSSTIIRFYHTHYWWNVTRRLIDSVVTQPWLLFQNANEFADNIATSLIKLFEVGYDNFHLVGFSLGAQISGEIGRAVIRKSKHKYIVPRITGLDPGQIPSFFLHLIPNLNAGDAKFVDTIHGETKLFGSAKSVGNASFWVNSGISQPDCVSHLALSERKSY